VTSQICVSVDILVLCEKDGDESWDIKVNRQVYIASTVRTRQYERLTEVHA